MPNIVQLYSRPYYEPGRYQGSMEAAGSLLGTLMGTIEKKKRRGAEDELDSDLAKLMADGGADREKIIERISRKPEKAKSILGAFFEKFNPQSPYRQQVQTPLSRSILARQMESRRNNGRQQGMTQMQAQDQYIDIADAHSRGVIGKDQAYSMIGDIMGTLTGGAPYEMRNLPEPRTETKTIAQMRAEEAAGMKAAGEGGTPEYLRMIGAINATSEIPHGLTAEDVAAANQAKNKRTVEGPKPSKRNLSQAVSTAAGEWLGEKMEEKLGWGRGKIRDRQKMKHLWEAYKVAFEYDQKSDSEQASLRDKFDHHVKTLNKGTGWLRLDDQYDWDPERRDPAGIR